jgi:hypothetical protein
MFLMTQILNFPLLFLFYNNFNLVLKSVVYQLS